MSGDGSAVWGTVLGVPASNLPFAGSVDAVPLTGSTQGSTQGQVLAPKNAGYPASAGRQSRQARAGP